VSNKIFTGRAGFFLDAIIIAVLIYAWKWMFYWISVMFFAEELDPYSYRNMEARWPHYFILFLAMFSAVCGFYLLRGKLNWKTGLLQVLLCVLPAFVLEAVLLKPDYIFNPIFTDLGLFFGATLLYLPFLIFQPGFYVFIFSFLFTPLSFSFLFQLSETYLLRKGYALR
jgi:hypothetical protein